MSELDDLIDDEIKHHGECAMKGMSLRQSNCACELALRSAARAELAAMREVIARADELVNVTDRLGEQAHDALRFYKGALPDAVEANISRVKDDAKLAIFYYRAARESVK